MVVSTMSPNSQSLIEAHLVGVGAEAEVLNALTGVLWSAEEEGVGTGRGTHGELIEGQALAASLLNARAGSRSEAKRGDGELGHLKEAVVVGYGTDQDDGLASVLLGGVLVGGGCDDLGDGHRWAVDLGHKQTAGDGLVELAVGPSCTLLSGHLPCAS